MKFMVIFKPLTEKENRLPGTSDFCRSQAIYIRNAWQLNFSIQPFKQGEFIMNSVFSCRGKSDIHHQGDRISHPMKLYLRWMLKLPMLADNATNFLQIIKRILKLYFFYNGFKRVKIIPNHEAFERFCVFAIGN